MAVFLKNVAKSLLTNVLPDGPSKLLPSTSKVITRFREDLDKSEGIVDELRQKALKFGKTANLEGFGKIHKRAFQQLKTGEFGTSKEERDREMLKSMGLDFSFDDSSFEAPSSEDEGQSAPIEQKNYYGVIQQGDDSTGETVSGAVAASTVSNLGGMAVIGQILSEISQGIGLMNAFHGEKTSAFYDMSVEAQKAIFASQEKQSSAAQKMYDYYSDLRDRASAETAKAAGVDMGSIFDPSRILEKINGSMLTSDMALGGIASEIGNAVKDPLGFLAATALFGNSLTGGRGIVGKMFGDQIDKVERFAGNAPYMLQNKLESWSAGREYGKGFSLNNILATIGDAVKLDTGDTALKLNRDADGAVSFDAATRRSIITEIPGYLSKILFTLERQYDVTSSAWGTKADSSIGHTIYDQKKGQFVSESAVKKDLAKKVGELNRAEWSGGLGSRVQQVASVAGLDKRQAGTVQKVLVDLANSGYSGAVDLKDKSSLESALKSMWHQEILKPKGMSEEEFGAHKEKKIAARLERVSPSLEKLLGAMGTDGESAARIMEQDLLRREQQVEKLRRSGATESDVVQAKEEIAKYKKEMQSKQKEGKLQEHYFKGLEDSFVRMKVDKKTRVDGLSSELRGTAMEKYAALNPAAAKVTAPKKIKVDGSSAKKLLDRIKAKVPANREDLADRALNGVQLAVAKLQRGLDRVLDPLARGVKTGLASVFGLDAKEMRRKTVLGAVGEVLDKRVMLPFKAALLGDQRKRAGNVSFLQALSHRWDRSILFPMKKALLGEGAATSKVARTSFLQAIGARMEKSVFMPLKTFLMGGNEKAASKMGLLQTVKASFNKTVLLPFKAALLGGDKSTAKKLSLVQTIGARMEKSVFMPLKTFLMGGNEKAARGMTVWKAFSASMDKNLAQPLKGYLFGDAAKGKSFLTGVTDWMGPRVNKLLFGEKASKKTLWGNIKETFKGVGDFVKDKIFAPMKNWFTKELMPSMKEMLGEFGTSIKKQWVNLKNFFTKDLVKGAKGVMNEILGDDTIQKLRKNVVDPFKNAVAKLTDTLGGVLRFFLRVPVNLFKGIADSFKLKRLKSGEGEFSVEERDRLMALDAKGSTFDFMRGVKKARAEEPKPSSTQEAMQPPTDVADKFRETGVNAGQGYSDGIESQKEAVNESVTSMAQGSVDTARKVLDIHSPSRVMREIGENTAQGFIDGLKSKLTEATGIMRRMTGVTEGNFNQRNSAALNQETENSAKAAEAVKQTKASNSILDKILSFMEGNLRQVDVHTKKILDVISKKAGVSSSTSDVQFSSNPLGWLGAKLDGLLRAPFAMLRSAVDGVQDFVKGLKDLPSKIMGGIANVLNSVVASVGKVIPVLADVAGKAMSKLSDLAAKAGETLISLADKAFKTAIGIAEQAAKAVKPLTDAVVDVTKTFVTALKPGLKSLSGAIGNAVGHLGDFAFKLVDVAAEVGGKLLNLAGSLLGAPFGRFGEINVVRKVSVVGWSTRGATAADPLYVHVVDGKIQTYHKERPSVRMNDNVEDVHSAANRLKSKLEAEKKNPDEKSNPLDALKGVAGTIAGTAAGGVVSQAAGKLGGLVTTVPGKIGEVVGKKKGAETVASAARTKSASKIGEMTMGQIEGKMSKLNPDSSLYKKLAAQKDALQGSRLERAKSFAKRTFWSDSPIQRSVITKEPGTISRGISLIKDKIVGTKAGSAVANAVGTIGKGAKAILSPSAVGKGLSSIGGTVSNAGGAIGNAVSGVGSAAGKAISGAGNAVGGILSKGGVVGRAVGGVVSGAANVAGGTVGLSGKILGQTAVNAPAKMIGGVAKLAGGAVSGVSNAAGKLAGAAAKIGTKGLTIGGLVGGIGELISDNIFEKGGHAHKIFTNSFSSLGGASTGAMLGSMILPGVGTIVGGVIGAVAGGLTDAMRGVVGWIEDVFSKEIKSATTAFLEFPDKLVTWIDKLPEKVDKFAQSIPDKIMSLFAMPDESQIDPTTGLPVEEKPSILWKMMTALGKAGVALVASAPKLGLTLVEALSKMVTSTAITAFGFIGKGFMKIGHTIGDFVEDAIQGTKDGLASFFTIKVPSWVPGIGGKVWSPFESLAETPEQKQQRIAQREARHSEDLQKMDEGTKALISATNKGIGKIGDFARTVTGANALAEAGSSLSRSAKNENRYAQAMEAAKGDESKAKEEYAKKNLITEEEAAAAKAKGGDAYDKLVKERTARVDQDAGWQSGKKTFAESKGAANDKRYKEWLSQQKIQDSETNRAKFDQMVEMEQRGRTMTLQGKSFGTPEVEDAISKAASIHGIPRDLMAKMAIIESNMNPNAKNPSGAKGLYQFVPSTAAQYGIAGREMDPYANAEAAARLFKDNMRVLQNRGLPVNQTTLYLAHQQGAAGVSNVWSAARSGVEPSSALIKNMATNDPFGQGKYRDPRTFFAAWEKKLGGSGEIAQSLGVSPETVAAVKVDTRVAGLSSPASVASSAVAAATPQDQGTSKTLAAQASSAAPPSSQKAKIPEQALMAEAPKTPAARAASGSSSIETAVSPGVVATSSVSGGNVIGGSNGGESSVASAAAMDAVKSRQLDSGAIASAVAPSDPNSDVSIQLMREQNRLLEMIAGNTKGIGTEISSAVQNVKNVTQNDSSYSVAQQSVARGGMSKSVLMRDVFGNMTNQSGDGIRPSSDAIRIASGGNLPGMSPIAA